MNNINKMKKVKIEKSVNLSLSQGCSIEDAIKELEQLKEEYGNVIVEAQTEEDPYEHSCYVDFTVYIDETDEAFEKRKASVKKAEAAQEKRELKELKRLQKKYEKFKE